MLLLETNTNVHSPRKRLSDSISTSSSSSNSSTGTGQEKPKPVRVDPRITTSSTRLRANLLHKLGIPPSAASLSTHTLHTHNLHETAPKQPRVGVSLLGNVKLERVPLKSDDTSSDSDTAQRPSCHTDTVFQAWGSLLWTKQPQPQEQPDIVMKSPSSSSSSSSNRRHVHFDPNVQVALIPTRHEYSSRIRRFLWDSPDQMQCKIVRNTLEFTADGWDWHTVLEEKEHFFNPHTNEYIHPVHLEIAQMSPEEQEDIVPRYYINPALITTTTTTATEQSF